LKLSIGRYAVERMGDMLLGV